MNKVLSQIGYKWKPIWHQQLQNKYEEVDIQFPEPNWYFGTPWGHCNLLEVASTEGIPLQKNQGSWKGIGIKNFASPGSHLFLIPESFQTWKKAWTRGHCPRKFLRIAEISWLWKIFSSYFEIKLMNCESFFLNMKYLAYL